MKKQNQIDNKIAEKLNLIGLRLATLKSTLELLLYCFENEAYSSNFGELHCFGEILNEYLIRTKKLYNDIEMELGVYN